MPNVDYAEEYDGASDEILFRTAGHYFPEHPECAWMLKGSVPDDVFEDLLGILKRQPFDCLVLHQPREDRSPPPSTGAPKVHELPGVSIELPAGLQGPAMAVRVGCEPDVERDTFGFSGDYYVRIDEGTLVVDNQPFGTVKRGDFIRVVAPGEVYVNGEPRGDTPRLTTTFFGKLMKYWNLLFGR